MIHINTHFYMDSDITSQNQDDPHKAVVKWTILCWISINMWEISSNWKLIRIPNNLYTYTISGIILSMCWGNERQCYNIMSSLIGLVHTQNDPCNLYFNVTLSLSQFQWHVPSEWTHRSCPYLSQCWPSSISTTYTHTSTKQNSI